MIDHVGIQVTDVDASVGAYLAAFGPIGMREKVRFPVGDTFVVGLGGPDGPPDFWFGPPTGSEAREIHIAFAASDRESVDAVHEAGVKAGLEVLHAPREFPEYHPGYYAVFFRDPDGHNVEAVYHGG